MKRQNNTNDWRERQAEPAAIDTGLFTPPEEKPVESPSADVAPEPSYEVIGNSSDNSFEISDNDAVQPITYNSGSIPDNVAGGLDLNAISPDPNALPPFPIWGLPELLQKFVRECSEVYGVPHEFAAVSVIQAVGCAVGKGVHTYEKFKNFAQSWIMIVAPSGVGKSEPMFKAFHPLTERDGMLHDEWCRAVDEWTEECFENKRRGKKEQKADRPKPIPKQKLIVDVTTEAIFQALYDNPGGLTLFRDELIGWFNELGRYSNTASVQHYLSLFDGRPVKINRKTSDPINIQRPFLSMLGSVQPPVLTDWLRERSIRNNGFSPRFMYVWPDNVKKADPTDNEMSQDLLQKYELFIYNVLELGERDYFGIKMPIQKEAKKLLRDFEFRITRLVNGTEIDHLKAHYGKMMIHVNRLVIAVAVARCCAGESDLTIDVDTMRYSIELGEYFIATGEKVSRLILGEAPQREISNPELVRLLAKRNPALSQGKIAEALGISQPAVSKFLKEK